MSAISFYVTKRQGFLVPYLQHAGEMFDALPGGFPILGRFSSVHRSARSIEQNDRMWATLGDIAKQCVWHGKKYDSSAWKDIFTAALKPQNLAQGLDGNLVLLGDRTRDMTVSEMTALIELMNAFAAQNGIVLREPVRAEG